MRKPLGRTSGDEATDAALNDLYQWIDQLMSPPFIADGRMWSGTIVNAATTRIYHGLGRAWQGWFIVDMNGATTTGRIESVPGADKTKILDLAATGWGSNLSAKVWVF